MAMNLMYAHPVFHGTVCVMTFLLAKIFAGSKQTIRVIKAGLIFGGVVWVFNVLMNHRGSHMLFYFLGNPITLEAMAFGLYIVALMMTMMAGFLIWNQFLNSERFLYLFSRISPKIALILHLALRFAEIFGNRARELTEARRSRQALSEHQSVMARIQSSAAFLTALVSWNLEESMEMALALKAKGYGQKRRTRYAFYQFGSNDGMFVAASGIVMGALIWARALGIGAYQVYPRLDPLIMTPVGWICWGFLTIYLGLPLLTFLAGRRGTVRWIWSN